jgi:hypothetical protein
MGSDRVAEGMPADTKGSGLIRLSLANKIVTAVPSFPCWYSILAPGVCRTGMLRLSDYFPRRKKIRAAIHRNGRRPRPAWGRFVFNSPLCFEEDPGLALPRFRLFLAELFGAFRETENPVAPALRRPESALNWDRCVAIRAVSVQT